MSDLWPSSTSCSIKRRLRYAALIAGLQVFVEGSRWPMVPAYALTVIILVVGLLDVSIPGGLYVSRVVAVAGVGLGVVAFLLSECLVLLA
jgi:hypothetical protein